jgi:hypothetical protein
VWIDWFAGGKWQKYVSISRAERVANSDVSDEFVTGWSDPARKVHGEDQEAILPARCMVRIKKRSCPQGAWLGSRSEAETGGELRPHGTGHGHEGSDEETHQG